MKNEIWKPVIGYKGWYDVSSFGRVRSVRRRITTSNNQKRIYQGRLLVLKNNENGYSVVTLIKCRKKETRRVHRLVAKSFINNRFKKPHVNHKDSKRSNNKSCNLEWVTRRENYNHAYLKGKYSATTNPRRAHKLNINIVCDIRRRINNGDLNKDIAAELGISKAMVSFIGSGKRWKSVNYKRYV